MQWAIPLMRWKRPGAPLIGHDHGNRIAALFEGAEGVDRRCARLGSHDAIAIGIATAQIAVDSAKDLRIVVDSE